MEGEYIYLLTFLFLITTVLKSKIKLNLILLDLEKSTYNKPIGKRMHQQWNEGHGANISKL